VGEFLVAISGGIEVALREGWVLHL